MAYKNWADIAPQINALVDKRIENMNLVRCSEAGLVQSFAAATVMETTDALKALCTPSVRMK